MNSTPQSTQDDLSFLRSLVVSKNGVQASFGEAYLAGGVCYGAQMILSAAQSLRWLPASPAWSLAIGISPTLVFLVLLALVLWRGRRAGPTGVVGRAVSYAFNAVGIANLALILVIGSVAWRQHSLTTWLIYPCTVFVLQGTAWLVAFHLRRRVWLAMVSAGWFVTAIAMAFCVQALGYFILVAGAGFLLLMVVPGVVMIRLARRDA
jgi:hypothetical protein